MNPDWRPRDRTEEDLERVRMALAEVGYGDADLVLRHNPVRFNVVTITYMPSQVPRAVFWSAVQTAGLSGLCRACYMNGVSWLSPMPDCLSIGDPWVLDCGQTERPTHQPGDDLRALKKALDSSRRPRV
jgi:hypothetical protein